jgi:hypothetical protein
VAAASGTFSEYKVNISADVGRGWTGEEGTFTSDGSFQFTRIAPGNHHITLSRDGNNGLEVIGTTDVEISNSDVADVSIQPYEPATVRARVYLDQATKPLTIGSVFLQPISDDGEMIRGGTYQFTPENGTYVLRDVAPGRYVAGITNAPHCFLKSIQVGRQEEPGDAIEIKSGSNVEMVLNYSSKLGIIRGRVKSPEQTLRKPIHVIIVAAPEHTPTSVWIEPTDQTLNFSVQDQRPGRYLIFAAEDATRELWEEPSFLELLKTEGTTVSLHEGEQVNTTLSLVTPETISRARKQLGLQGRICRLSNALISIKGGARANSEIIECLCSSRRPPCLRRIITVPSSP